MEMRNKTGPKTLYIRAHQALLKEESREDQGQGEAAGCMVAAPVWAEEESSKESWR